jgi:hypothetical protein
MFMFGTYDYARHTLRPSTNWGATTGQHRGSLGPIITYFTHDTATTT